MDNQTYLVTGGCGFLGQYIVKNLNRCDPNAEIRVLDIEPRSTFLNIESIPGVKILSGDLKQKESFSEIMKGVNTVIHCAGLISFKRGDEERLHESNIAGTKNLLESALENKCQNIVFISSISSIGMQTDQLADETMLPDIDVKQQTDAYGYSKLLAEQLLQAQSKTIRVIILNPSVILGPGSKRITKIMNGLRWIPFCPMIPTLNSFVDVRDVATATVLALESGQSGERYIVTTENIGMIPFMKLVVTSMGKKIPVFPTPKVFLWFFDLLVWLLDQINFNPGLKQSQGFNRDKAYSAKKIRDEMGWRPQFSLSQTVQDMVKSIIGDREDEFVWQNGFAHRRF